MDTLHRQSRKSNPPNDGPSAPEQPESDVMPVAPAASSPDAAEPERRARELIQQIRGELAALGSQLADVRKFAAHMMSHARQALRSGPLTASGAAALLQSMEWDYEDAHDALSACEHTWQGARHTLGVERESRARLTGEEEQQLWLASDLLRVSTLLRLGKSPAEALAELRTEDFSDRLTRFVPEVQP